jgi:hypothetical protein
MLTRLRRGNTVATPDHNAVSPTNKAPPWGKKYSRASLQYAALSPPQPVPEDLCELRDIVADITYAANRSPFVQTATKQRLSNLLGQLDAECSRVVHLTGLAQSAAGGSANVLLSRIRFFDALDERIRQISALRRRFVDSRDDFREKPAKALVGSIRDGKPLNKQTIYIARTRLTTVHS